METTKVLQVAASHLRSSTLDLLERHAINNLTTYRKENYGFFIVANTDDVDFDEVPSELAYLLGAAETQGCYYLEVDYDFPISPNLQVFKEDEDCGCL